MIHSLRLAAIWLLASFAPLPKRGPWTLPKDARVIGLKPGFDVAESEAAACRTFRLSEAQVRYRFHTYHRLTPEEEHDRYLWLPCWMEGTILYGGRSYSFKTRAGHLLSTTWPDGKWKELGGVYDDDPSAGEVAKSRRRSATLP